MILEAIMMTVLPLAWQNEPHAGEPRPRMPGTASPNLRASVARYSYTIQVEWLTFLVKDSDASPLVEHLRQAAQAPDQDWGFESIDAYIDELRQGESLAHKAVGSYAYARNDTVEVQDGLDPKAETIVLTPELRVHFSATNRQIYAEENDDRLQLFSPELLLMGIPTHATPTDWAAAGWSHGERVWTSAADEAGRTELLLEDPELGFPYFEASWSRVGGTGSVVPYRVFDWAPEPPDPENPEMPTARLRSVIEVEPHPGGVACRVYSISDYEVGENATSVAVPVEKGTYARFVQPGEDRQRPQIRKLDDDLGNLPESIRELIHVHE